MGGCSHCVKAEACGDRKGTVRGEVERALAFVYPSKTWGEPDDQRRFRAGVGTADGEALAAELADALDAATLHTEGGESEYCDYIYVLCVGREPPLVHLRDAGVAVPAELRELSTAEPVEDLYLRISLSHMARLAAVQQVALQLAVDGEVTILSEVPRPGVYAAPLLPRFQRLVAVLPAYDITHVDFGEIMAPPSGYRPGRYAALYGGVPSIVNYLFYPQPPTTRATTLLR